MEAAPKLVLASILLFTASALAQGGAAPSLAVAKKTLETARTNLSKAVEKIQADPPSTADLDAAHVAVDALKDAIDSGAAREQDDLDYAKAALAARKELRTQRDYVDARRAKVHIFNHRRTIDAALAASKEAFKKVEAKEPGQKDFDDARAAADALKKAVDEGRQFTSQDQAFATYVAELDATVVRTRKAVDDRWVLLSADKHRALVEEARQGLSSAMGALGKGATDAQFDAADKAATLLTKRLDEGKPLEADAKYGAFANKTRGEVAAAKKKMDEQWTATGLARLKGEIEPTYKDLLAAAKLVRAKKPTPDQLAEARTISIVVRKLVEKFAPEAARSQAFGEYVAGVKNTLVEVEVQLQLRTLDAAKRDVTAAMRKVESKKPTEENFEEATSALLVLEKTLEAVHSKDPAMAAPAADAKLMLRDSRTMLNKRRTQLEVAAALASLKAVKKDVTAAMRKVEGKAPTDENFQEATSALLVLEKTIEAVTVKDAEMNAALKEARTTLRDFRTILNRRRGELDLAAQTATLDGVKKDVEAAMRKVEAKAPPPSEENFQEATSALLVLEKTIAGLDPKIPGIGKPTAEARKLLNYSRAMVAKRKAALELQATLKTLAVAKKDVNLAMRKVESKGAKDEHFEVAASALLVLEKTLGTLDAKDPALAAAVQEAKILLKDSKAMTARRRLEVDVDVQKAKVEDARRVADGKLAQLGQPTAESIKAAEEAVNQIGTSLEPGAELVKKSRDYAAYDREVKKRITGLNKQLDKARLVLSANDGKSVLADALAAARAKLDTARAPTSTDADIEAATKSVDAIIDVLEKNAALETQAGSYASAAEKTRNAVFALQEAVAVATQARELRKRTGDALAAGAAAFSAGEASRDLRVQKTQFEKAAAQFKACKDDGNSMVEGNAALVKVIVLVDGRPANPREVLNLCNQRLEATTPLIKPLVGLIAFDDGPKKAFEKAKQLLAQGKKKDALAQFDECTATGVTVAYRHPELKERQFEVAGQNMTLNEVNKQCTAQSKSLRGK